MPKSDGSMAQPATPMDIDSDEDDPVVSEIPVYLNRLQDPPFMCGELYVLLNTMRHQSRPYGDQGQLSKAELDDANNRLRITYTLDPRAETYDQSSTYPVREQSLIGIPASRDTSSPAYCVGILHEGSLNLVPVTAICTVRPSLDYIDAEAASRKTAGAKVEDASQVTKQLTGKALHYQQLMKSINPDKSVWRRLDHYDYDSVEAADLIHQHILVDSVHSASSTTHSAEWSALRALKVRPLDFLGDQDQYLHKLSSWVSSSMPGGDRGAPSAAQDGPELNRLEFGRQIEAIMKRHQLIRFSELMASLPANTRARYAEADVLAQLDQSALCISGVFVVLSYLSSHRPQLWDTRDALLILLHAGRDVTVQLLSSINNLGKDDIEEILRGICSLDLLSNTWKLKVKPDTDFSARHHEVVKRHEAIATSIVNRLKQKKERQKSAAPTTATDSSAAAFSREEQNAMIDILKSKLVDGPACTTDELRQTLQTLTRDHFVSEAMTLELLRLVEAIPIRERWAVAAKPGGNDALRRVLIGMYRNRDALTKQEIVAAITESGSDSVLTDHDLRKLIKEFARNERGHWVFNGEPIAELRAGVKKEEGPDGGDLW